MDVDNPVGRPRHLVVASSPSLALLVDPGG
jgi:hypothetical protein